VDLGSLDWRSMILVVSAMGMIALAANAVRLVGRPEPGTSGFRAFASLTPDGRLRVLALVEGALGAHTLLGLAVGGTDWRRLLPLLIQASAWFVVLVLVIYPALAWLIYGGRREE
jgi:hypothetical protein